MRCFSGEGMTVNSVSLQIPPYLEKGSSGPAVNVLLSWLKGFYRAPEIECDAVLGDIGDGVVKRLQSENGLEPDGGVGPDTRTCMKEKLGFDFEDAARNTAGDNIFVQLGGERVGWNPAWAKIGT